MTDIARPILSGQDRLTVQAMRSVRAMDTNQAIITILRTVREPGPVRAMDTNQATVSAAEDSAPVMDTDPVPSIAETSKIQVTDGS